jgi:hypothetical protein
MDEELFTPYDVNLPQGVEQEYGEDEVWALRGDFNDVLAKGWNFSDFYQFAKDRVVFWTADTSISYYSESPSHHEYTIDMIFPPVGSSKKKTLHVTGVNTQATIPLLSELLALFVMSHLEEREIEIIFKAFATNPRKPFGGLDLSSSSSLTKALGNTSCRVGLSFQFVTLPQALCCSIFSSKYLFSAEFRQCSAALGLRESLRDCKLGCGPQRLKISCTQQEFTNLSEGLRDNQSLKELELQLHFIFSPQDIQAISDTLKCENIEKFTLEYLDIDDQGWTTICQSLGNHSKLQVVTLAFTDSFVDAARRLTPERRRARAESVIKMIQTGRTIQEVVWPHIQHDEELIPEIKKYLEENKAKKLCYS